MMRDARILLDTQALRHNLARVRDYAPHSQILSMVKADAYGHGLAFALDALADTDAFGVAFLHEARQVRAHSALPIVLMEGVFSLEEWQEAAVLGASCVIHQACQIDWALSHVVAGATLWLKLNTGMNRLGLAPDALLAAAQQLRVAGYHLILTMHFANADEPDHPLNAQQLAVFHHIKQKLEPIQASICNSAALMQWPQYHFNWVRPGIMLYGSSPFADRSAASLGLTPVMTLQSRLIAFHDLAVGDAVGYGSRWIAQRPTRLGVVAMGYGDGYPRVVQNAVVNVAGQLVALVGRVSMDMLMVDVTDLSPAPTLGQPVVLWGQHPPVDQVASAAATIGYELLCRLSPRPQRVITDRTDTMTTPF
jgi:alanine racemase